MFLLATLVPSEINCLHSYDEVNTYSSWFPLDGILLCFYGLLTFFDLKFIQTLHTYGYIFAIDDLT